MFPDEADPTLTQLVKTLVSIYSPEKIYLFGSKARGTSGPDSDYDFLVVVPDDSPPRLRRGGPAYEALWGLDLGVAADVLVWSKSTFEERRHLKASLPGTVLREGKLVHGQE